jgi:hypothetical protein
MVSLPKLHDFRHFVGAILSVMPVLRKREYLELQRETNRPYAELKLKAFQLDIK